MAFTAALLLANPTVGALSKPPIAYAQVKVATTTQPAAPAALVPSTAMCNCYAYVRSQIPSFPPTWVLKNNSSPHVGAVAIFDYDGTPHYGIISKISEDGFWLTDSNYGGCGIRTHFIALADKHITGFWSL